MFQYTLHIHGMMCSMCEAHVSDAIRKNFDVKKVKSKRKKNISTFVSETKLDETEIRKAIDLTGYELKEIEVKEK